MAVSKKGPVVGDVHFPSLLWTLVRTDFKVRYHGSVGGFLWAILRPISLFLVLQAVFALIFKADPEYRLNLVIGLFIWDFFLEGTRSGLGALASKAPLLTKVPLSPWIFVVTSGSNALITLTLFVVLLLGALATGGAAPAPLHVALFVSYLFQFFAIIVGFSLAASVLFLRYRDLNQVWDLVTQVGFFVAPIVYPLGILPERIHFYLYCWPPTAVIQFSRMVLVSGEVPTLRAHLFLMTESIGVFLAGVLIYWRYSRRAVELL